MKFEMAIRIPEFYFQLGPMAQHTSKTCVLHQEAPASEVPHYVHMYIQGIHQLISDFVMSKLHPAIDEIPPHDELGI